MLTPLFFYSLRCPILLGSLASSSFYSWFDPVPQSLPFHLIGLLPHPLLAWQGTDLMHNHVLADVNQSCVDAVGCRGSGFPSSDQSEDSDYDSVWITHTNRMGSISRKSRCSNKRHSTSFYFLYIECEELFVGAFYYSLFSFG